MKSKAPRRLLILLVPLGLLAALGLAFAFAPAPTARRPAPPAREANIARSPAAMRAALSAVSSRSTSRTVTFTLQVAAPQDAAAHSPDLDQGAPAQHGSPSRQDIARATVATRAFLEVYLPYSYGQPAPTPIPDATPDLRRALMRRPPIVAPGEHALHPRLLALGVSGGRAGEIALLGTVGDGRVTYAAAVTVIRARGRWLVSAVW